MQVPGALWVHQLFHFLSLLSKPFYSSCIMEVVAVIYCIPWTCEEFCAVISYIVWNTVLCLFFFLICLCLLCYCALQIQVLIYSGWNYFYINLQGTKCLLSEISVGIAGRCCGNPRYSFLWPHRERALYYSWLWWPMGGMASISVRHLCYYS